MEYLATDVTTIAIKRIDELLIEKILIIMKNYLLRISGSKDLFK